MVEAEVVYTRDRSSGRVHTRYRVGGNETLATREGCNLDVAGAYDEIDLDAVAMTNPALLCGNDFRDGLAISADADDGAPDEPAEE